MKKILKAVFVIIGTLIGAGFASGQEIYIFFYQYGVNGILGIIISRLLLGFVTYKVLCIFQENELANYKKLFKKNYKKGKISRNF